MNSKTFSSSTTIPPADHLDDNNYDSNSATAIHSKDSIYSDKDKL